MSRVPIRVLCLFSLLDRGGAETMCMNIYRNIDRNKIQFDFLVYYPQRGQYEDEIEKLGGRVYRIPHLDPRHLLEHINAARYFFEHHKEYQIVHNHMGENGGLICHEAKKAGIETIIYHSHVDKAPIISWSNKTAHSHLFFDKKQFKLMFLYPFAFYNASDYFACGTNAAKVFGKKKDEVKIIKNAINLEKFKYNPTIRERIRREMSCNNKFVIGNVARINDNKNQVFAIEIMKELMNKMPYAEMWFVGDGEKRAELEKRVAKYGYKDRIRFLGIRNDIDQLLQAMDVFLFPSISEGLPVSCIEAQATGLPCVFSDGFDSATIITNNCKVLSLSEQVSHWANAIMNYEDFKREDCSEQIRDAGYDIKITSKWMEEFYLKKIFR